MHNTVIYRMSIFSGVNTGTISQDKIHFGLVQNYYQQFNNYRAE